MSSSEVESIKKFYEGSEIFITGGSGYIGKVLIEKLLRSCTRIKAIYLLMRPKKNKTAGQRIQELSDSMLFDTLKEENPDAFEKLHVIEGDAGELGLGICESDLDKLKTCSVIFHAAASVRFDDPLKSAILLNTRGTREMCKLAQTMANLKALVHVSTAYIQPRNLYVKEELSPNDARWETYIDFAENLDEDLLNILTSKLTRFAPNTYTFTKNMAEQVCVDFKRTSNLPITIFRPSIVSASETEPLPGWCDNLNGPMSLIIVSALGLNHATACKGNNVMDVIPVDVCVKGMIVAAYSLWKSQDKSKIPILNAASIKLVTYDSMVYDMDVFAKEIPSINMFGIPKIQFVSCIYYVWLVRIFRNLLPALVVDGILKLTGKKPKLMKIQRIICNADTSLKHFYQHHFKFDNYNFIDLNLDIPAHEKDEFSFNDKYKFNNQTFYYNAFKMCKKVLLHETDKDEELARQRYPYIYVITRTVNLLFIYTCYKLLQFLFNRLF